MADESVIILEGGLGNRMRVAASAYALARETGLPLRVLWLEQWGMRCRFDSLFEPYEAHEPKPYEAHEPHKPYEPHKPHESHEPHSPIPFSLRDGRGMERLLFARPTLRNLHLPRLLQRLCYRDIILSPQVLPLVQQGYDFKAWFRRGHTLMTAFRDFHPWQTDDLRLLFRPVTAVRRLTAERTDAFSATTIGVHIRRTDHQTAIEESPTELFTQAIDSELDQHPELKVYLATDDEPTKTLLRTRYGSRIMTSDTAATRDTTSGLREALADMFALSRTRRIYGSANSTFSQMAACLGDIPIKILTRHGLGSLNILATPGNSTT